MKTNLVYFLTCAIIWGITWIAIKYQIPYVDGSVAVFYRFIFSSFLIFIICLLTKKSLFIYSKSQHLRFFLQGLFLFCLNYLLTYWASSMATSALVALAFTALIFFNMFAARIFLATPFDKKVIWGSLISFSGMAAIAWNEYLNIGLHPMSLWGFVLSLIATLSACAGNIFSTFNKKDKIPIMSSNAWSMLYGSLVTLSFCLIQQKSFTVQINKPFLISFFYLSVFGTVISFWAYLKLIENIGPSKAAFTSVASPVIALSVSTFYENLHWTPYLAIGAILCIIGNITALSPKLYKKKLLKSS
ncbi:MAG: DMT family transporter [Pseudobdellovibrio sp.]